MAAKRNVEILRFGGLANSFDESKVPDGQLWAMSSAQTNQRIVEGSGRYGDVLTIPAYNAGDVGLGCFYAQYGTKKEIIAVVKRYGVTTAEILSVDPDTGLWGQIASGLSPTPWTFKQYQDRVYCCNATDGTFMRTLLTYANDEVNKLYRWKAYNPEFYFGGALSVQLERPGYQLRPFINTDTATFLALATYSGSNETYKVAINSTDGAMTIQSSYRPTSYSPVTRHTHILTTAAAIDLSDVDYIYFEVESVGGGTAIKDLSQTAGLDWTIRLSEDATTAISTSFYNSMKPSVTADVAGEERSIIYARVDISNIANVDKDAVRRIAFSFPLKWGSAGLDLAIKNVRFGGANMWGLSIDSPAINYAYAYYNPTTGVLTPATKATLAKLQIEGKQIVASLGTLGAWVKLTVLYQSAMYSNGYTRIKVFRQKAVSTTRTYGTVVAENGSWYEIGDIANALVSSADPTFRDTTLESDLPALPLWSLTFDDSFTQSFKPTCLGVWKQHFLNGYDRKVWASWAAQPLKLLPAPESDYDPPEESDTTQGRTLYMSYDQSEQVYGFVEQDSLYAAGPSSCYTMIGDRMLDSTPFRRLPASRGTFSATSMCAHRAGALIAAEDGLWYYEVSRAFTGSQDNSYTIEEVTKDVRGSWKRVVNGDGSKLIVISWQDEVFVFNGTRYLRLTKPDPDTGERSWEEGTFPTVVAAFAYPGRGIRVMLSDGRIARFFYNASGNLYRTDNGATATWSVETGWMITDRRRITGIRYVGSGAPTFTIKSTDGVNFTEVSTSISRDASGRAWLLNVNILPGIKWKILASGVNGTDTIEEVRIVSETLEPGEV